MRRPVDEQAMKDEVTMALWCTLQMNLVLKGAACGPEISLSASVFSFGSVAVNAKEIRTLQVRPCVLQMSSGMHQAAGMQNSQLTSTACLSSISVFFCNLP